MAKVGPLLSRTLGKITRARSRGAREQDVAAAVASIGGDETNSKLPVVVKLPTLPPQQKERWHGYRGRVTQHLGPVYDEVNKVMGGNATMLPSANALQACLPEAAIVKLAGQANIESLELDPVVQVIQMDDAILDIELGEFRKQHPMLDGSGVVVAVLDSGVDDQHPFLSVSHSVSVCGEDASIPGSHGTHCAGSIASRDMQYPGVAPGVKLLNVKVLTANGGGRHTDIIKGLEQAIELGANVISMSIGFNHLPTWSSGGHGWSCMNGDCPLCTAVDNAVALENVVVVAAAGNEHERAQALRDAQLADSFDTELTCPGQARSALTVAAISKQTFNAASFSSRGPTSYKELKPNLAAPGINVTSLAPVPRDANGKPVASPPRSSLFSRKSGTSMATPIVAGAAALTLQRRIAAGKTDWTPAQIRNDILELGLLPIGEPAEVVGQGRLSVRRL